MTTRQQEQRDKEELYNWYKSRKRESEMYFRFATALIIFLMIIVGVSFFIK